MTTTGAEPVRVKLTEAQTALLRDLSHRPQIVSAVYRPATALVDLRLARWRPSRFGESAQNPTLAITTSGQNWLANRPVCTEIPDAE